jgi:hypothetical protein
MPIAALRLNGRSCQGTYVAFKNAVSNAVFIISEWN